MVIGHFQNLIPTFSSSNKFSNEKSVDSFYVKRKRTTSWAIRSYFSGENIFCRFAPHALKCFLTRICVLLAQVFGIIFYTSLEVSVSWFAMCSYSVYEFMLCPLWCLKNEGVKTYLQFWKLIERETMQYKMLWIELMSTSYTHTFLVERKKNSVMWFFFYFADGAQTNIHNPVSYMQSNCRKGWIGLFHRLHQYFSNWSICIYLSVFSNGLLVFMQIKLPLIIYAIFFRTL